MKLLVLMLLSLKSEISYKEFHPKKKLTYALSSFIMSQIHL